MRTRIRAFLLMCLMAAAAYSALGAWESIRSPWDSTLSADACRDLLRQTDQAKFYLRAHDGYIAVYPNRRGAGPERITRIEIITLRTEDQALLSRGIPASDRQNMLQLLEDLGS